MNVKTFGSLSDLVRPQEVHSGRNPDAGRNPAICSSYRTTVRNERENLRIAVGRDPAISGRRPE
jgi:hypothetical protein